jgi:rhodanese-related sulfurtransferase
MTTVTEKRQWWPVIRGAGCIVLISSLFGTAVNWAFVIDVLKGKKTFNPQKRIGQILQDTRVNSTSLVDAKKSHDAKSAVFIDSRSEDEYSAGHIAGAINIPWDQFGDRGSEFLERIPEGMPIIIYCGGSCESSAELAEALVDRGYTNVKILLNGWQVWVNAGYPTEAGE